MAWCFSLIPMHLSFYSSLLAWWPVSIEKLTSLSNLLAEKLRTSACLGFCSPCITCYNLIPCPTKRSKSLFYMGLFYFATLLLITSLIEKTWRDILLRTSMNSALLRLLRLQLGSKLQVAQRHKPHGLDKPELEKHGFTMYATFPSKTTRKPSSLHPDIVWIHLKIFTVRTLDYLSTHSWPNPWTVWELGKRLQFATQQLKRCCKGILATSVASTPWQRMLFLAYAWHR